MIFGESNLLGDQGKLTELQSSVLHVYLERSQWAHVIFLSAPSLSSTSLWKMKRETDGRVLILLFFLYSFLAHFLIYITHYPLIFEGIEIKNNNKKQQRGWVGWGKGGWIYFVLIFFFICIPISTNLEQMPNAFESGYL